MVYQQQSVGQEGGLSRRTLLRSGLALAGGLSMAGLAAACSSGLPTTAASSAAASGSSGGPSTQRPTDPFTRSDTAGELSPLTAELGLCMVQVQGAIKQFADAAEAKAKALGLQTSQAINGSNSTKAISQLNSLLQRNIGALFIQDLNPASQVPVIKQAIGQGMFTSSFNMPTTMQLTASQYEVGKQLAEGTLAYIADRLDNQAKIVHFNTDYNEALAPRDRGWRDVMATKPPGVQIVADIPGNPETQEEGNTAMASFLQKDPSVNVVDGGDTLVLGALSALRAAGRADDPNLALFGVNGDPQAVDEVASGGAFKATYAFNFAILGTLVADMAQRWMTGLTVPQLVIVPAVKIDSKDAIDTYNRAVSDPAAAYASAGETYFKLYGTTSYQTRGTYFDGTVS
jgi:ribose transport system substrate-binding protein